MVDFAQAIDPATGGFTETFRGALPEILGDAYYNDPDTKQEPTKAFDDIKDLPGLMKVTLDSRRALSKKMENVIQRPGKDAKPEEIQAYQKQLAKELGAPDKPEDYEFTRPQMPDGVPYDEDLEKTMRQMFAEAGVPKATAKAIYDGYNKMQLEKINKIIQAEQVKYDTEVKELQNDWQGDKMLVNGRVALQALLSFADPDTKKLLADSKLSEHVNDPTAWRKFGVSPYQLRIWHRIGEKMGTAPIVPGSDVPGAKTADERIGGRYKR
jgi:DNA-binding transcriptional MerR regulator